MLAEREWLAKIVEVVRAIADRSYQARSWFGMSEEEVSSPEEIYNQLFDDLSFHLFFTTYSSQLTDKQRLAWKDLENKLESYAAATPEKMDPKYVFNDPRWDVIRNSARDFLEIFSK